MVPIPGKPHWHLPPLVQTIQPHIHQSLNSLVDEAQQMWVPISQISAPCISPGRNTCTETVWHHHAVTISVYNQNSLIHSNMEVFSQHYPPYFFWQFST